MFDWFWEFLYGITKSLLRLIDGLISCANKLCGIESINIDGTETDLVSYMLRSDIISNGFKIAAVLGFIVLVFFTIARIIMVTTKEKPDMSPTQVAVKAFKTVLLFLFVPMIMLTMVWALNTLLGVMYAATRNGSQGLGNFLFGAFSQDATIYNQQLYERIVSGAESYYNTDLVSEAMKLKDFDFIFSWITGLVLLFTLANALVLFVDRAISIGVLFIVSPFSIASSVLDDGNRFKLWREQVLVKFLSGYGIILYLNVYCLLVSIITPSSVVFFDSSFLNGLFKLLIIIGGAFALQKSAALIGNLIGSGAGSRENMDSALTRLGTGAVGGGLKLLGKGLWSGGKKLFGKGKDKDKDKDSKKGDDKSDGDGNDPNEGDKMNSDPKYGDNKGLTDKLKNGAGGDGGDKKGNKSDGGNSGNSKDNKSGTPLSSDKNAVNQSAKDRIIESLNNHVATLGSIPEASEEEENEE